MIIIWKLCLQKFLFIMLCNIGNRYCMYKFPIRSVDLFKYFKSSSLFCNDCYSLHLICSMSQWQWWEQWIMTSVSTECRISPNIVTNTLLSQPVIDSIMFWMLFLACLAWPVHFHAGAILLTVQAPQVGHLYWQQ